MSTSKTRVEWLPEPQGPNKRTASGWRAIYVHTERGFGLYVIKTPSGADYARGGLPEFLPSEAPY